MPRVPPEAERLLTSEPLMAHLATSHEDRPHVAPVWFAYDDGVIEVLTSGQKLENVRRNPRVAVSVQKDVDGVAEWMVALRGTATVVEDEEATRRAAERIFPRYGSTPDSDPENSLVRIDVGSATYRMYGE